MQAQVAPPPQVFTPVAIPQVPVLHASYVKSGSYFLWKILDGLFRAHGSKQSFVQNHPIQQLRNGWADFSIEQFDIDQVLVQDDGVYWQVEVQHIEPIRDLTEYLQQCSHIWTHSFLCERSWEVLPQFGRCCYIIRDPRDALVSMAHFVQTPFMRRFHPHAAQSAEEYLATDMGTFLEDWCRHASGYLRAQRALDIEILHYEHMVANLDAAVRHIATWIGLPLDDAQIKAVSDHVNLRKMKANNPQHVRRGGSGGFREILTTAQRDRAFAITSATMREAGYDPKP